MNASRARSTRNILLSAAAALVLTGCLADEVAEDGSVTPPPTGNGAPTISGSAPRMIKVGVAYAFAPIAADPDGDALTFSVSNRPAWLNFNTNNGALTGTPLLGSEGTYNDITIEVSDGSMSASLAPFSITVEPSTAPNMPPEISGTPPAMVTVGSVYQFTPTVSDPDGDALTFTVQNLPGWASFNTQTGAISGVPQTGDEGTFQNIALSVSDGQASASLPAFSITVNPANAMPTISGTPPAAVVVGNAYTFTPVAADPNGDVLTFSVNNLPAWASFDAANGTISGTPQMGDVGVYNGIALSVSDGVFSAALPNFSITVNAANTAPQISGTPSTAVNVGQSYSFTPVATDADGDTLTFSIQNRPSWAQFDTASGALTGTPQASDVGQTNNIVISVSDGTATTSLSPFSIAVNAVANGMATLSWTPPTQNTDGSPLTDLAGYRIYYGNAPGDYSNTAAINNPGVSSYVVNGLTAGTWYFVSTTINTNGVESAYSNVATKTIN